MRVSAVTGLAFIVVLCASCAAQQPCALSRSDSARVDVSSETALERGQIPGISIAVVRNGQIACLKSYGAASLPHGGIAGRSVTADTRFAIGSVSKQFTAAAILFLVDRGRLSLDDTVSKFLPELSGGSQVTLRQLLSHTSGYAD